MSHIIMKKYEALDIETIWKNNIAKPICIAITCGEKIKFKKTRVEKIDSEEIIRFLLENCSSKKIYYVHNLSFEMFVFMKKMMELKIRFKITSADCSVYSAEIYWGKKKIKLRCSYKLTMLSLKKLAELAEINHKEIFPYEILNENIKEEMEVEEKMFKNKEEFSEFSKKYGKKIKTFEILEDYCKNDAKITKESIIKYWNIIEESGMLRNDRVLTAAKLSVESYFKNNCIIKRKIPLKYDRIIRKGYYGGRTEVFGNPKENEIVLHYDWNGMYAQCMMEKVLGGEIFESDIVRDVNYPGFYWIKK